ncbi:Synaptic vesicle membrane protein VAT-1 homolog [Coccomyxa sp. Obi]|nr:Synaptic vesicle membrane protein VAT-1 homolog [Coccomyxa sp. Obi]
MQAIVFDEPGDEGVLQLGHVPVPELKPTSVRIKVEAAGVNRADIMQRLGNYPPPEGSSEILGLEAAGTISEVGSACTGDWKVGDRVMALCSGGAYAEEVVVDAGSIMKVPESWKMVEAAGFMEVTLTAYLNIFQIGGATKGKSVLIHGGGSGVGSQAIAMCKAKGVTTFVTAGSDDKCERCLQRGASYVLNYKTEKIVDLVKGMTKGKGVDVILDCVGAPYLEQNLECLAMDGKVVYIGLMGGAVAEKANLGVLLRKRASLIGSTLRNRSLSFKAELVAGLRKDFADERKRGDIKPIIDKVVPLESAADAHRRMAGSTHFGKIILNVKPV